MGAQNKLLTDLGSESLVYRTFKKIQSANFSSVQLITGHQREKIQQAIPEAEFIHNPNFEIGMHSSIRVGLEHLPITDGFVAICLGDQPLLEKEDYDRLILHATHPYKLVYPSFEGKRGNPVLISLSLREEILQHEDDDKGCSYLFKRYPEFAREVEMPTDACLVDVDTPEALQQLKGSLWKTT